MKAHINIGLNTLYQVIGRAVTAISGLIATRMVTGALGVEGFGDYQIVLTYVTLFWMVTDFGLNAIAVREMAENDDKVSEIFNSLFTLRTALGALLVIVSWLILFFLPYSTLLKQAIILCSSTIFLHAVLGSTHGLFQLRLRYDQQLIGNVLGAIASLSLVYATLVFDWGIWGFWWAFVIATLVIAAANFVMANRWVKIRVSRDLQQLKYLFRETLPFGTALLLSLATFKIDGMLLSVMPLDGVSNNAAVGIYNVAYRVFELIMVIPVFFMNPVYPILVRKLKESFDVFRQSVVKAGVFLLATSGGVVVGMYLLAPFIIGLVTEGDGFVDSIVVLRILVLATPLFFLTALMMWNLVTLKRQKELIIVYLISFGANILLNLFFIPRYHYWAAAVITGITELLILILLSIFVFGAWRSQKQTQNIAA